LIKGDWLGVSEARIQQLGEIALPHQGRGNGRDVCVADRNPIRLNISEVKQLVAPDGEAQSRSELVLVIRRGG
jgi:hypothetical protein